MRFSKIKISSDPKVIGVRNGIYQIEIVEKQFPTKRAYDTFQDSFSFDSFDGIQELKERPISVKLLKSAKLTDFMGFCPYLKNVNFAISQKALSVFKKSNLKKYEILPLTFINNDVKEQYFFFFICIDPS